MNSQITGAETPSPTDLYLDLLKRILTRTGFPMPYRLLPTGQGPLRALRPLQRLLRQLGLEVVRRSSDEVRAQGLDWPVDAETMIGWQRLDHLERCIRSVLADEVPGDLLEAGVWRGGATILMRGTLQALGDQRRCVWVADSFRGLPRPDMKRYPIDASGDRFWRQPELAVSIGQVRANFAKYGLLDERVRFLEGWFEDSLPSAPIDRLALLRLDGDMYGSTMDALRALYAKVSIGGYIIIDDYAIPNCRRAVDDFRAELRLRGSLRPVDWTGAYWRKGLEEENEL